jgi:hypothetical protein
MHSANLGVGEIIFLVEKADEGDYTARAVNESIFTEADTRWATQQRTRGGRVSL